MVFTTLVAGLFVLLPLAHADSYPPFWDNTDVPAPVHFAPVAWPSDSDWNAYTFNQTAIRDRRTQDPSNGGTSPQNYVNISSRCSDQSAPSVYWKFDTAKSVMFLRFKVEQIPNTYATGPAPGSFSNIDPWKCAQWTVLLDIDGDGYREFAVHIDGCSGLPATSIDIIQSIYSNTKSQSIDYAGNPLVYRLFHNPTAFVDRATNRILNFRSSLSPSINWPNGSAETVWDYGTSRVSNISTVNPKCEEYQLDFQIPLAMLDATSVGGPKFTVDTPFCMAFVTANSNVNPLQKDLAFDGTFSGDENSCVPCGDMVTLNGAQIPQPTVDWVEVSGCGPSTITAKVRDALGPDCANQSTVSSVEFFYYPDINGDGLANDAGTWTSIGMGAISPTDPSLWSFSGWNSSNFPKGLYLIGAKATDTQGNITWSYLPPPQTAPNYANPSPTPGVVYNTFNNICGKSPSLIKTVNPASTTVGNTVQFTITVDNPTLSPITVTNIIDNLPPNFTYVSTNGGTIAPPAPAVAGDPQIVTWTFSPAATVPASGTRTLIFTANVGVSPGTYSNAATAVTSSGTLKATPVDVGVGSPELTISKAANLTSARPGDTITYTITFSNNSPVNTTNVVITDTIPAGLSYVAGSANLGGTYNSTTKTITWNFGSLPSGDGPYTLSFSAVVDEPYTGAAKSVNTASIVSTETPLPKTASAVVYVLSPLFLSKVASPHAVDPAGSPPVNQTSFTITYANISKNLLSNVVLTDPIPAGFTYVSASPAPSSAPAVGANGTVTWNIGNLTAETTATVTLTVQATNPFTGLNPTYNTATISATGVPPISSTAASVIINACTDPITYYFHNLSATGLTPAANPPVTTIQLGTDRYYADTTAPTAATPKTVGPKTAPACGDGSSDDLLCPNSANRIEVAHFYTDSDTLIRYNFNGNINATFYFTTGNGQLIAARLYVYQYNAADGSVVLLGNSATAVNRNLTNAPVTFNVSPVTFIEPNRRILFRLTALALHSNQTQTISVLFDGIGSQSQARVCYAPIDQALSKQVDRHVASPGDALTYTVRVTNAGSGQMTNTTLVDTIPAGVQYTGYSVSPAGPTCTAPPAPSPLPTPSFVVTCNIGLLGAFATSTVTLNATIDNPLNPGLEPLINRATLSSDQTSPETATATTNIVRPASPNLSITKSASKTLLVPNDIVTYSLLITNTGTATANNVTINDVLPVDTYFTYVAGSSLLNGVVITPEPVAGGIFNSNLGALAAGASATITLQMLVGNAAAVPAGFINKDNVATMTEATTGPYTSNIVRVTISKNPNLRITKNIVSPAKSVQTVGIGDAAGTRTFNATLANRPVSAGSLIIKVAGAEAGADSGGGVVLGSNLKASTINYATGALRLEFIAAPADGAVITAEYHATPAPGSIIQYEITVRNIGGTDALDVQVADPIPSNTSYINGTLTYEGSARTDSQDTDNAHYDSINSRVSYTPGTLAPGVTRTMRFSALLRSSLSAGLTQIPNSASASASNASTKTARADISASAQPSLTITKAAPSLVPYPLATLNGNHVATTTLTLTNPPGSRHFAVGGRIYVNGVLRRVTGILSATQITVEQTITAASGTQVLPVIKYSLNYANTGNAAAGNVVIQDILPAGILYLGALTAPTTAPAFDTNGTLTWNIGTVNPGDSGTLVVYTRPNARGTFVNTATMSATAVPSFPSNPVTTVVGALELDKYTNTPSVVNNGGTTAQYVLRIRNPFPTTTALNVSITDALPQGFTYAGPTAYANCGTPGPNPAAGAANPVWTCGTIAAGATATITFTVNIAATAPAGTYQNGVTATSSNVSVIPFDELNTTAEDVTVTIPADLKVVKGVNFIDGCFNVGCRITYDITVTNVGTSTATNTVITDPLPAQLTYAGVWSATLGAYAAPTWTIAGNITPNSSVVQWPAASGIYYTCIRNHTSAAGNQPPDATYWVLGGTGGADWAAGQAYTSASATLSITATVNTVTSISNTASINQALTVFQGGATDTNPSNDSSTKAIIPTLITLSDFSAYNDKGKFVVQWSTSSELDTAGFYLYRLDEKTGRYRQINRSLLPALLTSQQGGTYSLIDHGASLQKSNTYLLLEIEGRGTRNAYGPFTVTSGGGNAAVTRYSSSPVDPAILLIVGDANQPAGRITRYQDSDGTLVVTNMSRASSRRSGTFTAEEVSGYTRQAKPISAEKIARIAAIKASKEKADSVRKRKQGEMVKIAVSTEGLYYLDSKEIAALLGITSKAAQQLIQTGNLALSNQGSMVAYLPSGNQSGIYFYGEGIDSAYTKENIYWLYKSRGSRMSSIKGGSPAAIGLGSFTETVHREEDKFSVTLLAQDPESDYWFWDYIVSGNPSMETKTFSLQAFGVADLPAQASLTVNLHGYTNTDAVPDHHAIVSINGTIIGEGIWDADSPYTIHLPFSQKLLREGENIVEIKGLLDTGAPYSIFMVNSFDLTYQRLLSARENSLTFSSAETSPLTVYGFTKPDIFVFDITDPNRAVLNTVTTIAGSEGNYRISFTPLKPHARYLVTTSDAAITISRAWAKRTAALTSKKNSADYLIITTEELAGAARELAVYRQGQGMETMVVNVEDIMDEFNYGISSPAAIKNFLGHAYYEWRKSPKYVLLAGEGSFDYKNHLGYGDSLVPPQMRATPFGLSPSDTYLADTDGDYVPDMAIGRLSVGTAEELKNAIEKIRKFEAGSSRHLLLVADYPDEGGNFPADSDALSNHIPKGYSLGKIYLSSYTIPDARNLLFDEIRQGTYFLNYIGHASVYQLSGKGLLTSADIPNMTSLSGLPVLTALSCVLGQYAIPGYDTLSEDLVVKPQGGAVAVWSAAGMSFNFNSTRLGEMFYSAVFSDQEKILGDAVNRALKQYSTIDKYSYMLEIYNLQGDPALRLR